MACALGAFMAVSCLTIITPPVGSSPFGNQIEDLNFAAYCLTLYDTNLDGFISATEADAVTEIRCPGRDIRSLQGVELFRNLKILDCSDNKLTTLDLSRNRALTVLNCGGNELKYLDVTDNPHLKYLNCNPQKGGEITPFVWQME